MWTLRKGSGHGRKFRNCKMDFSFCSFCNTGGKRPAEPAFLSRLGSPGCVGTGPSSGWVTQSSRVSPGMILHLTSPLSSAFILLPCLGGSQAGWLGAVGGCRSLMASDRGLWAPLHPTPPACPPPLPQGWAFFQLGVRNRR